MSVFTQKHYEHFSAEMRRLADLPLSDRGVTWEEMIAVEEVLCRIFERDNCKFKRDLFREQVGITRRARRGSSSEHSR